MKCDFINENILDYLDDQLDPESRESFEDHLSQCHSCQNLVSEIRLTYQLVTEDRQLSIGESFVEDTISRLHKKEARVIPMLSNVIKPIAVAASIALGIIIGNGELSVLSSNSIVSEEEQLSLSVATPSDYSVWQNLEEEYGNED